MFSHLLDRIPSLCFYICVSFGRVAAHPSVSLLFCLCLCLCLCVNTTVCVCVCVHVGMTGVTTPAVCPLAEWWRQSPAHWPTFIEGLPAQPSRPWPQRWRRWRRWWWWCCREGEAKGKRGHELGSHTIIHRIRQWSPSEPSHMPPPPLSQASCRRGGGERLISWEGSPKMKIDVGISTAVGRPLESFPLLKAPHFHSGGKGKKKKCSDVLLCFQ